MNSTDFWKGRKYQVSLSLCNQDAYLNDEQEVVQGFVTHM